MAEDSTPVLKESLEKCFVEQQLALKQLTRHYQDLEDKVELVDCFFTQLDGDQEENRVNLEKLEKRVTQLKVDLESESELFEERVGTLKTQNAQLRNHINLVTDMVNSITRVLNKTFNNEPVDEVIDNTQADDYEPEDNDPTQRTLRQVYDMYQSQPRDEEGWDEMTKAIEAAEEYEASLQKQQQEPPIRVNGLTQDEWNDLLRI